MEIDKITGVNGANEVSQIYAEKLQGIKSRVPVTNVNNKFQSYLENAKLKTPSTENTESTTEVAKNTDESSSVDTNKLLSALLTSNMNSSSLLSSSSSSDSIFE